MEKSKYYLMLITNLHNAAIEHKKHCVQNCGVSLTRIKWAANELSINLDKDDLAQFNTLQWPF